MSDPTKLRVVQWPNLDRKPGFRGVYVAGEWHVEEWAVDQWETTTASDALAALLQASVDGEVVVT